MKKPTAKKLHVMHYIGVHRMNGSYFQNTAPLLWGQGEGGGGKEACEAFGNFKMGYAFPEKIEGGKVYLREFIKVLVLREMFAFPIFETQYARQHSRYGTFKTGTFITGRIIVPFATFQRTAYSRGIYIGMVLIKEEIREFIFKKILHHSCPS